MDLIDSLGSMGIPGAAVILLVGLSLVKISCMKSIGDKNIEFFSEKERKMIFLSGILLIFVGVMLLAASLFATIIIILGSLVIIYTVRESSEDNVSSKDKTRLLSIIGLVLVLAGINFSTMPIETPTQ